MLDSWSTTAHNSLRLPSFIAFFLAGFSTLFAYLADKRARTDQLRFLALGRFLIEGARACLYASLLLLLVIAITSLLRQG